MGTGDKSSRSLDVRMRQNESRSQGLSCDVCDEFRFSLIAAVKLATANIVSRFTLYSQSGAKIRRLRCEMIKGTESNYN